MDVEIMKSITSSVEDVETWWPGLLRAFIGCFVEERERETTAANDVDDDGCQYVFCVVRRALRYLVYDGDAPHAKIELECLAEIVCRWLMRGAPTAQNDSSCVSEGSGGSAPTFHRRDGAVFSWRKRGGNEKKEENFAYGSTRLWTSVVKPSGVLLPCSLVYVVYCLACSQCVPQVSQKGMALGQLVCLLFGQLPCTSAIETAGESTKTFAMDAGGLSSRQGVFTASKEARRLMKCFLSGCGAGGEVNSVFLFIDAYHAWLMRDYHSTINHAERLLCSSRRGEKQSCLLWLLREALQVIHAFAVVTVTSTAHPATRNEIKYRLRRVEEGSGTKDPSGYCVGVGDNRRSGLMMFARPPLTCGIYCVMHCELFCSGDIKQCNDMSCPRNECASYLGQAGLWCDSLFLSLRTWLRAKLLTDRGRMAESRDLLLMTLLGHDNDAAGGVGATILANEVGGQVAVRLLPFFWLRQLLLVNCAALADTHALLRFLRRLKEPLTVSEAMYVAACPTLAAGGVHSPIFASFPSNCSGAMCSAGDAIGQFELLPLSVRVPLLSHRLWLCRRGLLYEAPWCFNEDIPCETYRLSLCSEVLHLCEALVSCVRGLVGSLELSFTDCAPHRVMFSVITVACEVQESILRDAASGVAAALSPTYPAPPQRNYGGDSTGNSSDNGSIVSPDTVVADADSGLSSSSSVAAAVVEERQDLYWAAHRMAKQWMDIFEDCFPQLQLMVQVCRLRIAAASFDGDTASVTQRVMLTFRNNALAAAHCVVAFSASLHVVSAEQCICKALERYPHSAELRRLHRTICGSESILEKGVRQGCGKNGAVQSAQKKPHVTGPTYTYRYRGLLSVRHVAFERRAVTSCMQIAVSLLCVCMFVASFVLHLRGAHFIDIKRNVLASSSSDSGITCGSTPDTIRLRVSFALPCSLPLYWGCGIIIYAVTAAVVIPFFASRSGNPNSASSMMARLLCALMDENCMLDNTCNRLVFCMRGLPLINLVTGVQLAVANALQLDAAVKEVCACQWIASDGDFCGRVVTVWGAVCLILLLLLLVVAIVFHSRAWGVLHCRDAITGSLATFITVFFIDVVFFAAMLPLLFVCCAVLEPVLFLASMLFGGVLSLPLLVEHIPSVPSDNLLAPQPVPEASCLRLDCGESTGLFCARATLWLCERLCASMPPLRWTPSGRHDRPIVCVHEVLRPPLAETDATALSAGNAALASLLQMFCSRAISLCIALHRVVNWRSYCNPRESEAAVQLALLREGCAAALSAAPRNRGVVLADSGNVSIGPAGVESVVCLPTTPPVDAVSKVLYG